MNAINFTCRKCGEMLNCAVVDAGREVPCPGCGAPIIIPFSSEDRAPARAVPCAMAAGQPRRVWGWVAALALTGFLGFGAAWLTLGLRNAKAAAQAKAVGTSERVNGGPMGTKGKNSAAAKPDEVVAPVAPEARTDSNPSSPDAIRILQHRIADSLPTGGDEKPITLSAAEKKRGLKLLVVDVALPADEAATYPGTKPIMSDEGFAYVRGTLEAQAFRFVLHAPNFKLQLPSGKATEGTFIKWPERETWCPDRDTIFSIVLSGGDACIFHSARSLVMATNRNPATLKATLAFKVPGRAASRGTPTIRYEPTLATEIVASLPPSTLDPVTGMALGTIPVADTFPTPDLELQRELGALFARAGMNALEAEKPAPTRAAQPRYRQPMPDGPNTITVANQSGSWLGLGIFCRKIGNDFQYGSVQGVPAGGNTKLVVPNGTFHVYWIRQDRPNSRFRMPDSVTMSGGNDRIQKYVNLTIGSSTGQAAIEEEF